MRTVLSNITPLEVLRQLRELFSNPRRHVRGPVAVDRNNYGVDPESPQAIAWCVRGAMSRAERVHPECRDAITRATTMLEAEVSYGCLAVVSDSHDGRRRILKVIEKAIARQRSPGAGRG